MAPGLFWWKGVLPFAEQPAAAATEEILGFTFMQPYGSAVIDGPKRAENRPKPPWSRLSGRAFWIAVHAGVGWYPGAEESVRVWRSSIQPRSDHGAWLLAPETRAEYPTRRILGLARVVGCIDYERTRSIARGLGLHDDSARRRAQEWLGAHMAWAFGPAVWLLDPTVVRLDAPIPHEKGALGLWSVPPATLEQLRTAQRDRLQWRTAA